MSTELTETDAVELIEMDVRNKIASSELHETRLELDPDHDGIAPPPLHDAITETRKRARRLLAKYGWTDEQADALVEAALHHHQVARSWRLEREQAEREVDDRWSDRRKEAHERLQQARRQT